MNEKLREAVERDCKRLDIFFEIARQSKGVEMKSLHLMYEMFIDLKTRGRYLDAVKNKRVSGDDSGDYTLVFDPYNSSLMMVSKDGYVRIGYSDNQLNPRGTQQVFGLTSGVGSVIDHAFTVSTIHDDKGIIMIEGNRIDI